MPALVSGVDSRTVLFTSWHGTYSDNPRAISEELIARDAPYRQVWVLDQRDDSLPPSIATVRPGSREYLRMLGVAHRVVTNVSMPGYFRKKRGTEYLQTWHGTPLKRIAFDIERPAFESSGKYLSDLRGDVASWDMLLSPNRFSTKVFRQAFGYEGEIVETGYPRNDLLSSPAAEATREAVRSRLGIPEGVQAVLYAPTWRDTRKFTLELELERLMEELGDGYRVLLRAHSLATVTQPPPANERVLHVSDVADIRELYLAADVLLTDYSSSMFDFAITGKPMLFYTYDLREYRDETRGFYFDFEAEAPGPLLSSTSEVAAALQDLDGVASRHAAAYASFAEQYCYLEDGGAASRVVDAFF